MAHVDTTDVDHLKTSWEIENARKLYDPERDALYELDVDEQKKINDSKPWREDPHYFKNVRVSANALMKMTMHARSGGSIEVMGLMQGKVEGDTFVVTDAFRLPVEGTETRVNAGEEANEYTVSYLSLCRENAMHDNIVGWYHSHPGYGCWLSGIDVQTQETYQLFQDPQIAIVIDPNRTASSGRIEIGAFRTFPKEYKPDRRALEDGIAGIPEGKAKDFGAYAERYYPLEISHYKSTLSTHMLDLLWNKYWVSTLSQSPLTSNGEFSTLQIEDLSQKLKTAEKGAKNIDRNSQTPGSDARLDKVTAQSNKISSAEERGLLAEEMKTNLFTDIIGKSDAAMDEGT